MFLYYENGKEEHYTFEELQHLFNFVVGDEQKQSGTTFDSWLVEMLKLQILISKRIEVQKMRNIIEYGYDRRYRSWAIIVFDEQKNELENRYVGNKSDRDLEIKCLADKYNVSKDNIIKIKSY